MVCHPFSEGHLGPFDGLRTDIKVPLPTLAVNNTLCTMEKTFLASALSLTSPLYESKLRLTPSFDSSHPLEVFFNFLCVDHY